MREIKFRVWDERTESMFLDPQIISDIDEGGKPLNEAIDEFESNGQILLQFTGLKDKNGKEIYEGDILKRPLFKYQSQTLVVRPMTAYGVSFDTLTGRIMNFVNATNLTKVEVIGNKFENPELLK